MSYNYRQGGTPDHVDSSQSNADYPHVGISIPAAKTDATRVAMPDPDLPKRVSAVASNDSSYSNSSNRLKSTMDQKSLSPLDVLGMAVGGDSDAKAMLVASKKADSLSKAVTAAKKPQDKFSK